MIYFFFFYSSTVRQLQVCNKLDSRSVLTFRPPCIYTVVSVFLGSFRSPSARGSADKIEILRDKTVQPPADTSTHCDPMEDSSFRRAAASRGLLWVVISGKVKCLISGEGEGEFEV